MYAGIRKTLEELANRALEASAITETDRNSVGGESAATELEDDTLEEVNIDMNRVNKLSQKSRENAASNGTGRRTERLGTSVSPNGGFCYSAVVIVRSHLV